MHAVGAGTRRDVDSVVNNKRDVFGPRYFQQSGGAGRQLVIRSRLIPKLYGPCARGNITNYKWSSVLSDSRGRVVGECLFAIDSTGVRSSMAVPFAEHSDLVREGPFTAYNCFTSLLLPCLYSLCTLQWPRPRLASRTTVNT